MASLVESATCRAGTQRPKGTSGDARGATTIYVIMTTTHGSIRFVFVALLLLASSAAWGQSGDRAGEIQAPPPSHWASPPAPALSAEDALDTFRVAPGFRVEIVASDPLVFDPVAMAFGADGRIWVVEMRAYMPDVDGTGEDAPIGTIAFLEDTDGDGRMDKRTEFAGGFVLPRAVAPIADGVLVAEPPNLWFLKDTNGDGKADERTRIADDYGNPASPEHAANGLMWGLDNWIYSANHTVRYRYERGRWRAEPTIFRGQWGITQDDFGRLFYNSNSDPLRMDVLPAEYFRRSGNVVEPQGINLQLVKPHDLPVWPGRITAGVNRGYQILREVGTLPIVTAACAPVVYRGTLFPRDFQGDVFIAEPAGNLVKRILVEERDGTPGARNAYAQTEFLTSTDERFRPVNLFNGPDGALYVVDMYRGVIQHRIFVTTYLRNQIKERGLESPIGMGRIYRVVPEETPALRIPKLAEASREELIVALGHEQAWWRDTAQRVLVERGDRGAALALRALVRSSRSSLARLHALWTLEGLDALDWPTVARALEDPEVRVAVAAARMSEPFFSKDAQRTLAALRARAEWGELVFQQQLALSLGAAPPDGADPLLTELARAVGDRPFVADAIVSSAAGRELRLLTRLKDSPERARGTITPVLVSLAAAVLKSNDASNVDRLLGLLDPEQEWLNAAIIEGVERFIPGEKGKERTVFLPREPRALIAFAASNSAYAARAREALEHIRWQGQQIDTTQALASLSERQRELFDRGKQEFAVCASCHQPDGQGQEGLAPPLVGSRWVNGNVDALVRIVINGKTSGASTMPPLRALDDETIAAILTYIRRSWGHRAPPVAPSTVRYIRGQIDARHEPWADAELEPMN